MPYEKPHVRSKYPHLLPSDAAIWTRFLQEYPNQYDLVDYDIHVGKGQIPVPGLEPNIKRMAKILTQRRIDVVAKKGSRLYVIEIKLDPGVSVIGQLVAYRQLYFEQFNLPRRPEMILITNRIDRDLVSVLKDLRIRTFVV